MKKKFLSLVFAAALLVTAVPTTAYADDPQDPAVTPAVTPTPEYEEYGDGDTANMDVTIHIDSEFAVRIPKSIVAYDDSIDYSVGVKGSILESDQVLVIPESAIDFNLMVDEAVADTVTATVTQTKQAWGSTEILMDEWTDTTGNITADEQLAAGDWKSVLTFNISIERAPGLYDADGKMLATWADAGIDVSTDYGETDKDTVATTPYYVITNTYPTATKIVVPHNTTEIGTYAFNGCSTLTEIDLGSAKTLGSFAFAGCTALTTVDLSGITVFEDSALNGCTFLTTLVLNDNIESIGTTAFSNCTNLTTITWKEFDYTDKDVLEADLTAANVTFTPGFWTN